MDIFGLNWNVAFRIDKTVELAARRNAVINLDTANFDDAIATFGIKSSRFGVENDFAQTAYSLSCLADQSGLSPSGVETHLLAAPTVPSQ